MNRKKNESFGFHFHTLNIIIVNINITMLLNDEHSKRLSLKDFLIENTKYKRVYYII